MKHEEIDVIVIGGGHAGCEAAAAAARVGANTVLLTMRFRDLGVMSCNPAIGGLGKGHLVREIDALDGIMGIAADRAGIQFRLLNRAKGPAVQGPRVQADRRLYAESVRQQMVGYPNLSICEGEVVDLCLSGTCVAGVILADGSILRSTAVVLATGTFLNGVIHVGHETRSGGRVGDAASAPLSQRLYGLGLSMGRLKTGTPPRLNGKTIDWSVIVPQPGDADPVMCSFLHDSPFVRQVSCGITHTNPRTHDIIRQNIGLSAMYGGKIEGIGPRYCPSIEDKVVRFSDKDQHQIFLEPEGLDDDTIYPNGISTSLPVNVQQEYVHSIRGLENAEILQPGYAIEYDFIDPRSLSPHLMLQDIPGLYFAGQINGTTGYEEAAAQGLVAGLNAAANSMGTEPVSFGREQAYIGVMIDDLTTQGVLEPYRMFTSRAEYRLSLRADNADQRLCDAGRKIGCVSDERWMVFQGKLDRLARTGRVMDRIRFSSRSLAANGWRLNEDGPMRTAREALSLPGASVEALASLSTDLDDLPRDAVQQIARDSLYSTYVSRQERDVAALKRDQDWQIPPDFNYSDISGLSTELKSKLMAVRPVTLAQASRINGMTPAALTLLLSVLRQRSYRDAV